jgi:hypothetical protein
MMGISLDLLENLESLLASGSALEVKALLSLEEATLTPTYLRGPRYRSTLRIAASIAATVGNAPVVAYFCEERGVPSNFVPPDEIAVVEFALSEFSIITPLLAALQYGHEDLALYLLSLPPGEGGRNLNLGSRAGLAEYPLLTLAAKEGMVRVVEELLDLGVDLLARDAQGQLAVSRAVSMCHVEVVDVLLEAHAGRVVEVGM